MEEVLQGVESKPLTVQTRTVRSSQREAVLPDGTGGRSPVPPVWDPSAAMSAIHPSILIPTPYRAMRTVFTIAKIQICAV